MADSTLQSIRTKVRRLTRSPSESLLTTAQIDEYVNTFLLYDLPEHLRLFNLKTNFVFYTEPFIDTYETNTTDPTNPLFNFKNKYITTHQPLYIAGYLSLFSQSQEQFYAIYPKINFIQTIGRSGDGVTVNFIGVINTQQNTSGVPVTQQIGLLRNNVIFDSIDANGNSLILVDDPQTPTTGNMIVPNNPAVIWGSINYITGAFNITFPQPPAAGVAINSQTVPYQPSRPFSMLYFNDKFTFRPIPDQAYKVEMEVFVRPTELLIANQSPQLEQWWQYIAYGATKKVFEDRMDLDSVQLIMPEYQKQEDLALRTTLVQITKQRSATIYTEGNPFSYNWNGWGYGGGQF